MRWGSRLTPRPLASMSLAQAAPNSAAESSNLMVSAEADDEAAMESTAMMVRIRFMVSSHINRTPEVKPCEAETGIWRGGTATQMVGDPMTRSQKSEGSQAKAVARKAARIPPIRRYFTA